VVPAGTELVIAPDVTVMVVGAAGAVVYPDTIHTIGVTDGDDDVRGPSDRVKAAFATPDTR
jgi:hypothetical protein